MKQTFKAFLLIFSLFFVSAFSAIEMRAQSNFHPEFEGTWVMDSVQVKEITSNGIVEKTVLPGDDYHLKDRWLLQFTLNADKTASFEDKNGHTFTNILCLINGNEITLAISPVSSIILDIKQISDKTILITREFTDEYNLKTVDVFWKMYYHKANK